MQALSLQKLHVIPDKIISMTCDKAVSEAALSIKMAQNKVPGGKEAHCKQAESCIAEHQINLGRVHDTFNHFVFHYDVGTQKLTQTVHELGKMMNLRFRDNAPRRPPRVIILGPPGSGRSSTAEIVSKRYGLVNVSPHQLVQAES